MTLLHEVKFEDETKDVDNDIFPRNELIHLQGSKGLGVHGVLGVHGFQGSHRQLESRGQLINNKFECLWV